MGAASNASAAEAGRATVPPFCPLSGREGSLAELELIPCYTVRTVVMKGKYCHEKNKSPANCRVCVLRLTAQRCVRVCLLLRAAKSMTILRYYFHCESIKQARLLRRAPNPSNEKSIEVPVRCNLQFNWKDIYVCAAHFFEALILLIYNFRAV